MILYNPPLFAIFTLESSEAYLFIRLAHFGLQVVPVFIHLLDEGVQLFAGFLQTQTDVMFLY